ncbi:MAG TPA: PEP-CTERM sorting domain-containing protein [Rhizomicrobium sp.]|jgi:hypothetical protein|nr:PEP-CTERM sorting domain-containing protein [Rhizomicrobium sp.]
MKVYLAFAAAAVLLTASPAFADSLFQNNFNGENGGNGVLNYAGFQNFSVSSGSVDLIGNGFYNFNSDSNLYVDMAGTTEQYGAITTDTVFGPGTYQITLDVGGSIYSGIADGVALTWAGCGSSCFSTGAIAGLTSETLTFNVTLASASAFTLADLQLSGNPDIGATLFGVEIQPVPEPISIALLGSGLFGFGVFGRRKKRGS